MNTNLITHDRLGIFPMQGVGKFLGVFFLLFLLLFSQLSLLVTPIYAASSPWSQTNWAGGSAQTAWSDTTKYDSASNITTSVSNQATLTTSEEFSNTGFESDLTGWNTGGSFKDTDFAGASGAVAAWPLDETTTTQSYARVVNPAVPTGRNVVINGGFDDTSQWVLGSGYSISGGALHASGATSAVSAQESNILNPGKSYSFTYTISNYSSGSVTLRSPGLNATARSANGTYTETLINAASPHVIIAAATTFTGDIDNVIITQLNIPASTSSPTQLLTDGDMETSGVASWTTVASATLSKQTTSPHGGSQVLRIARNGSNNPGAYQNVTNTTGQVYRVRGYARSDGSATPYIYTNGASTTLLSGTTSTSWQQFDVIFVSTSGQPVVLSSNSSGTQYVEYDDVVISTDTYIRSGEIIQDGDMEASGTGVWTAGSGATLSKQTTSPHAGAQNLRVTYTGSGNPWAFQSTTVVTGKKYRITGWYRGDGGGLFTPYVALGSAGTSLAQGTNSTTWQAFDVTATADSSIFLFRTNLNGGTSGYVEWDDISITEVDPFVGVPGNGVVLGSTAGGHLTNAYTFDGVNDYVNLYSSELNSAFNPSAGTIVLWAKVSGSGIWTDGLGHHFVNLQSTDAGSNQIHIGKATSNGNILWQITFGGTIISRQIAGFSSTDWMQIALTWNKTSDEMIAYYNGVQQSTVGTGLGTWAGNLNSARAVVGAFTTSGNNPWSGMMNDIRLYNRALTSGEISTLYNGTATTRDTVTTYNSSVGSAKIVASADQTATFTQSVNVGDTSSYNLSAYAYTTGAAVTSSDASLYVNGSAISTTYTSVGSGWYRLTGTTTGVASSVTYGVQVESGKTVYIDNVSLQNYPSPGTLTSSIFDSGQGSNWGTLTYSATTPSNTTVVVKVRTSNDSGMSGATAFASCSAITSGSDISANGCVTDTHRYAQYQITLSSSDLLGTPTFTSFSLSFAVSDATAPGVTLSPLTPDPTQDFTPTFTGSVTDADGTVTNVQYQVDATSGTWSGCTAADGTFNSATENFSCTTTQLSDGSHTIYIRVTDSNGNITAQGTESSDTFTVDTMAPQRIELLDPADNSYTNNDRPAFKWKTTTDVTTGVAKYILELGSYTIGDIPPSGTTDVVTSKYVIHFENFSDNDETNNSISVTTKSSPDWGPQENDGKIKEGKHIWTVKAADGAGNETTTSRNVLIDTTQPSVQFTKINEQVFTHTNFSTSDSTPTFSGFITDPLSGGNSSAIQDENGPKIASGPEEVEIRIEKKQGLLYQAYTTQVIHLGNSVYVCDETEVADNTKQKCDKYLPFTFTPKEKIPIGTYRISLSGKDTANNSSSQKFFTVYVTTPAEIMTPEEKAIIKEEIKTQPKEIQEKVEKEIEITKPVEPTALEKTGESISQTGSGILQSIGNFLSILASGIVDTIASAFHAVGSTLAFVWQTGGKAMAFIGNGIQTIASSIGSGYSALAQGASGSLRSALLTIGNGAGAIWKGTGNGVHAVAGFVGTNFQNGRTATQNGIANLSFAVGKKTEDVSHGVGTAFIKFGYLFIPEPTKIYSVRVDSSSPTTMTIKWTTNHPATTKVNYGLTEDYGKDVQFDLRVTEHEVVVTGLEPGTTYYYEVMSQNRDYVYDANHTYTTPIE